MALKDAQIQNFFDRKKTKLSVALGALAKSAKTITPMKDHLEPKWSQSGDKVESQPESKWSQSGVKERPLPESKWSQSKAQAESKPEPQLEPKWSHDCSNESFSQLVGLQKKIILFIYESCRLSRSSESQKLSISFISSYCNTTKCSIKKAIQRLVKKNMLIRKEFKDGRSGWTTYIIPNNIYYEITHAEKGIENKEKWGQSGVKVESQLEPQLEPPQYSSSNIYKTTTTGDKQRLKQSQMQFPTEWQNLDIEPLASINFTKTHLLQILSQNKLSPQIVQDSIYAFAFDLQENNKEKKIKGDRLSFFMGILCNGRAYNFPGNYESPQDRSLRIYRENKRKIEQERVEAEKEAMNLAFNEWFEKLTDDQKRDLLPEIFRNTPKLEKNKILESSARNKFEAEIWKEIKEKIVSENN